jgi:glycosyltransferase involved in cell wall biosynthesis
MRGRGVGVRANRILHVIPSLDLGGAERQLRYLCPHLPAHGFEPHIAYIAGGPNLAPLERAGVPLHHITCTGPYDPRLPLGLRRLARALEPALIQTWLPVMDILGGLVARSLGVPWVLSERALPSAYPGSPKLAIRTVLARSVAAVVSNSGDADAWWAERLPPGVPRRVIGNGIPLEEIDAAEPIAVDRFGLPGAHPLVLSIGRFDAGKNVEGVLDVFARVTQEGPAEGLLCGGGILLEEIRERIAREELGARIAAPGYVAQAPALLKRAAVFLTLSRHEGMPNAVMEAAAAGCPIVLSDIPAHRQVLDDAQALFVSSESVPDATRAVLACLRDAPAARARATLARKRAADWSVAAAAAAYVALYTELLAGQAPRQRRAQ